MIRSSPDSMSCACSFQGLRSDSIGLLCSRHERARALMRRKWTVCSDVEGEREKGRKRCDQRCRSRFWMTISIAR
jgi:hypothetical protein